MSESKRQYTLEIQGRPLVIRSDADAAHMADIEALVNERVSAVGDGIPIHSAVMLAALSLADDLLKERQDRLDLKEKIRRRSTDLLQRLDSQNFVA